MIAMHPPQHPPGWGICLQGFPGVCLPLVVLAVPNCYVLVFPGVPRHLLLKFSPGFYSLKGNLLAVPAFWMNVCRPHLGS